MPTSRLMPVRVSARLRSSTSRQATSVASVIRGTGSLPANAVRLLITFTNSARWAVGSPFFR